MTNMISEVYDAFLLGGVPEDKARLAAQALSAAATATAGDINALTLAMQRLEGTCNLLKPMVGISLAISLATLPIMVAILLQLPG